jgi:hypothetical protein
MGGRTQGGMGGGGFGQTSTPRPIDAVVNRPPQGGMGGPRPGGNPMALFSQLQQGMRPQMYGARPAMPGGGPIDPASQQLAAAKARQMADTQFARSKWAGGPQTPPPPGAGLGSPGPTQATLTAAAPPRFNPQAGGPGRGRPMPRQVFNY